MTSGALPLTDWSWELACECHVTDTPLAGFMEGITFSILLISLKEYDSIRSDMDTINTPWAILERSISKIINKL